MVKDSAYKLITRGGGQLKKIKLNREEILSYSEDDLFDESTLEAVYIIRQLRTLLKCGPEDTLVIFEPKINGNQVWIEYFDIWVPILSISNYEVF